MTASAHFKAYGSKKEDLAAVSVANYNYAADNPKAQMQRKLTMEEAMSAPVVVMPLTLYDCCPITDGAAAVIIASEEYAKRFSRPLSISGDMPGSASQRFIQLAGRASGRLGAHAVSCSQGIRAREAHAQDINVAQTHDCFSISEIIEAEELGFCRREREAISPLSGQILVAAKCPSTQTAGCSRAAILRRHRRPSGWRAHEAAPGPGDPSGQGSGVRAPAQLERPERRAYDHHLRQGAGKAVVSRRLPH